MPLHVQLDSFLPVILQHGSSLLVILGQTKWDPGIHHRLRGSAWMPHHVRHDFEGIGRRITLYNEKRVLHRTARVWDTSPETFLRVKCIVSIQWSVILFLSCLVGTVLARIFLFVPISRKSIQRFSVMPMSIDPSGFFLTRGIQ